MREQVSLRQHVAAAIVGVTGCVTQRVGLGGHVQLIVVARTLNLRIAATALVLVWSHVKQSY